MSNRLSVSTAIQRIYRFSNPAIGHSQTVSMKPSVPLPFGFIFANFPM